MHETELHYSEELIINAVKSFFRRKIGVAVPIFTVLITAFVIYNIIDGDRSWLMGAIGTLNVMLILFIGILYFSHKYFALKWFRRFDGGLVALSMDEDQFHLSSNVGSSHLKWNLIDKIWDFDGYFLVIFSLNEFVTVPTDQMSAEAKEFFFDTAQNAGAKIN